MTKKIYAIPIIDNDINATNATNLEQSYGYSISFPLTFVIDCFTVLISHKLFNVLQETFTFASISVGIWQQPIFSYVIIINYVRIESNRIWISYK